jgi:hypothetical protein
MDGSIALVPFGASRGGSKKADPGVFVKRLSNLQTRVQGRMHNATEAPRFA